MVQKRKLRNLEVNPISMGHNELILGKAVKNFRKNVITSFTYRRSNGA